VILRGDAMRKARVDTTAASLTALARQMGATVVLLNSSIDCLIYSRRGTLYAVDFKGPLTPKTATQKRLVAAGFPLHFVSTSEQLMALVTR
jgi:hypothetical protein